MNPFSLNVVLRRVAIALVCVAGTAQALPDDSIEFPGRYRLTLHPSIKALNCRSGPGKDHPPVEWLAPGVIVNVREVHASPEVWALTQWGCYVRARTRYLDPTDEPPTAVGRAVRSADAAEPSRTWSTGTYRVETRDRHGRLNCRAAPSIHAAIFAVHDSGARIHVVAVEQPEDPWLLTDEKCYVKASRRYLSTAVE